MMSITQLSSLLKNLAVSRCLHISPVLSKGLHYAPRRDPNQVNRGGRKYNLPPQPHRIHAPCPIKADPAMATTRDDIKLIFGPQSKLKRTGGRDPETGIKIFRCRGGGTDKQERHVNKHRLPEDASTGTTKYRVLQIQECEINNADLALLAGPDITYIIQPEGLNVGDVIEASRTKLGSLNPGCAYPLKLLPVGLKVNSVEPVPGLGSSFSMSSGTCCEIMQHTLDKDKTLVRHPSGVSQWIDSDCVGTIGRVKQTARAVEILGSWKASRAKGIKPRSDRQRTKNWQKRKLRHRMDQKWAKRCIRYLDDRPWAGQEHFVPETFERFRYHFGDRKPDYFIRRLKRKDPEILKHIDKRKFEPREEKLYQCSWEDYTGQKTEVMWAERQRWRYWKVRKAIANKR